MLSKIVKVNNKKGGLFMSALNNLSRGGSSGVTVKDLFDFAVCSGCNKDGSLVFIGYVDSEFTWRLWYSDILYPSRSVELSESLPNEDAVKKMISLMNSRIGSCDDVFDMFQMQSIYDTIIILRTTYSYMAKNVRYGDELLDSGTNCIQELSVCLDNTNTLLIRWAGDNPADTYVTVKVYDDIVGGFVLRDNTISKVYGKNPGKVNNVIKVMKIIEMNGFAGYLSGLMDVLKFIKEKENGKVKCGDNVYIASVIDDVKPVLIIIKSDKTEYVVRSTDYYVSNSISDDKLLAPIIEYIESNKDFK